MHGLTSAAEPAARAARRPGNPALACLTEPGTAPDRASGRATHGAISPPACARWVRAQGLRAGDTVALMVTDAGQIAALRLGLAAMGIRAVSLDPAADGATLAGRIAASEAALAVVDTGLAGAYAAILGRLGAYPPVWWNGADADFARLDLALAEYA